jgi:hypothetical protein
MFSTRDEDLLVMVVWSCRYGAISLLKFSRALHTDFEYNDTQPRRSSCVQFWHSCHTRCEDLDYRNVTHF